MLFSLRAYIFSLVMSFSLNFVYSGIFKTGLKTGTVRFAGALAAFQCFSGAFAADVTAKVSLDFSVARQRQESVILGIYGNEAPTASKIFLSLCRGDYGDGISYDGSQVSRVQRNKRIDVGRLSKGGGQKQETWTDFSGKVRIRSVDLARSVVHSDSNTLSHDSAGIVSVPRGGGSFLFTIAPKANADLDEENVVIGKVLSGMSTIEKINAVPVSQEDALGTKGTFSSLGKNFDGRAKLATIEKPLQKIVLQQCVVDESGSVASFLKF
jgi:cyclophilin family peptidyl-prolyl cis-trans isomerase